MKENARIRFNPSTKEVEIEGSEEFVNAMFNKIQKVMSGASIRLTKEPTIPSSNRIKKAGKRKVLPAESIAIQRGKESYQGTRESTEDNII